MGEKVSRHVSFQGAWPYIQGEMTHSLPFDPEGGGRLSHSPSASEGHLDLYLPLCDQRVGFPIYVFF